MNSSLYPESEPVPQNSNSSLLISNHFSNSQPNIQSQLENTEPQYETEPNELDQDKNQTLVNLVYIHPMIPISKLGIYKPKLYEECK